MISDGKFSYVQVQISIVLAVGEVQKSMANRGWRGLEEEIHIK